MICSFSNLDDQTLETIKSLEGELGKTLLAFSCQDLQPSSLDDTQLDKIKALEEKLGMSLVAVDA